MTAEGGESRANYLLKWEAIRSSREQGATSYDLWGLATGGIAHFKTGFGGREVHYIGAWDLVLDPLELVARLRAILRRSSAAEDDGAESGEKIEVDGVQITSSSRTALRDGEDLNLTSVEFELLRELLREAGKIVKKEDLSERVLERKLSPYDRSLDMHISNLRKKLGPRSDGPPQRL